jgi:hypothetical protein
MRDSTSRCQHFLAVRLGGDRLIYGMTFSCIVQNHCDSVFGCMTKIMATTAFVALRCGQTSIHHLPAASASPEEKLALRSERLAVAQAIQIVS